MNEQKDLLSPVWSHMTDIVIERAQGCTLYGANGTEYLDFTAGFGVSSTGHCHPKVVAAIQEQAAALMHTSINLVYHPPILRLVEQMHQVIPSQLNRFYLANSGAEGVESAVKLARQVTGKTNLIVFQNGFHGRSGLTMSLTTSKVVVREGYQPLMAGVFVAPYPYAYYYGWDEEATSEWCLKQFQHILVTQTGPGETAAVIIEPIIGEGGIVPAPSAFLKGLRKICDEQGILLIADEIQCGWGRSGKLFAYQHAEIQPDIVIIGKGLASGMPISAIAASANLMKKWPVHSHGGTFCGNAMACAAASATIDVMLEEKLSENAAVRGKQLLEGLKQIQEENGIPGEVRGRGLMVGFELSRDDGSPAPIITKRIQKGCLEKNMFLATAGPYGNVLRFLPRLIISENEIEQGLNIIRESI